MADATVPVSEIVGIAGDVTNALKALNDRGRPMDVRMDEARQALADVLIRLGKLDPVNDIPPER